MKTKLFIAFLMISSITFAQKKNTNQNTKRVVSHMKIDDIKGESNDTRKSTQYMKIDDIKGESNDKKTIIIGGVEKPYTRTLKTISSNSQRVCNNDLIAERSRIDRIYNKRKFSAKELEEKSNNQRTKGETTMGDIQVSKHKKNKRRRVVVAKSNKQGDPDSNKK